MRIVRRFTMVTLEFDDYRPQDERKAFWEHPVPL
jgi:hypothetical protein